MSFFDEVETTVANTRFLQAIEDNGPIVLNFKQPVQLADVEAFIRPRINIDLLLKPQTTAQYLFKQYLCTQKDEDAVHLLTHIENFRKIGGGPRRQLATKLLQDHAPLTGAASSSAASSTPGAAYVVPNESDTINPPQTLAPATSSSSAPASPTASSATTPPAVLPCLEHVLAKPPSNHATCATLRNGAAKELEAIQAALAQPGAPSVSLFDDLSQALSRVLEEKVAGFLRSAFFKRYVQLEDYSTREVHLKDFRIFRVLGRGAFGAVSAVQKIDTHAVYAMKEMSMKQVKQDQSEWMVINERKVLAKMNSPFVLGLKYSFHEDETLYLIFDMCAGGDLKFHLRNAKDKCFDAARAKFYAAEVLLGLQHIHEHDIVYRDLKPNNILLHQNGHVIISDLGLTIKLRKNKVLKHLAGTAGYWSPEIISKTGTHKTSDYWSFGVMLYEMLLGKRPQCNCDKKSKEWCPFGQKKNMEDNALDPAGVLKLDIEYPPDKINAVAKDFLSKLFIVDPMARLGANGIAEIKSHFYFADIDWEALACLEVTPPYVPDPRTVNANSIGEVGEFNTNQHKNIQLTADDYKMYEGFRHTSLEGVQIELVEALTKMDNPDSKNNPANASTKEEGTGSCCIIL